MTKDFEVKARKAGRPMHTNKPRKPKAELQVSEIWGQRAGTLIKTRLEEKDWTYRDLAIALKEDLGVDIAATALNRRVNRGNFSAGFLLMCKDVLGISFESYPDEREAPLSMPKARPKAKQKRENSTAALDKATSPWGQKKSP